MEKRIKKLEEEICWLRKEIEDLKKISQQIYYHYNFPQKEYEPLPYSTWPNAWC